MVARIGGVIVALIGALLAFAGGGLGMAMLGRPVPDLPLLRDLTPYLLQVAQAAPAVPPGSGWGALAASSIGIIALAGLGAGALIMLAGVVQVIIGRRSQVVLVMLVAGLCGFAIAAALA